VNALREYIAEIQTMDSDDMPPPKRLQQYGFQVDALERRLLLAQQEVRET